MTDNIITMPTPLNVLADRIRDAIERTEHGRQEWFEGTLELMTALADARSRFPSNTNFSIWIAENDLDTLSKDDRLGLLSMAEHVSIALPVLQETTRSSWQHIWREEVKPRVLRHVTKTTPEPESNPEVTETKPAAVQTEEATVSEEEVSLSDAVDGDFYPVPKNSKLYDLIGIEAGTVLHKYFKHRFFLGVVNIDTKDNKKECTALRYVAARCVRPDYPPELRLVQTWSLRLMYPHLPQRMIDSMPKNVKTLMAKGRHSAYVETERQFMLSKEFGVTNPPMLAFNKAHAIYTAIVNAKNGHTVDPAARHNPTFNGDDGKPPVIVRGTQLWPTEVGVSYRYDDLRCAYGLANDILLAFKEPADASMNTQSLKLRHVLSWLPPGGYNSTGTTLEGVMTALKAVVNAYSANRSDEMRSPPPSLKKRVED